MLVTAFVAVTVVVYSRSWPGGVLAHYTPAPYAVSAVPSGTSVPNRGPLFGPSPYVPPQPQSPIVSGTCQANCGPGPMVPSSGITGPTQADAYVEKFGHTLSTISPPWDASAVLNVVIADVQSDPGSGYWAFFFARGKYVGMDVNSPSNDVLAIQVSSTEITLRYSLYDSTNDYTGKTAASASSWPAES